MNLAPTFQKAPPVWRRSPKPEAYLSPIPGPSGPRRECAVRAFWRRQNLAAGGIHFRRACKYRRGRQPFAAETQKEKHDLWSCLSFWKGRLKSIFSSLGLLEETLPNGPSGPRAEWRVNSRPAAGNCAGAALPTPSIEMPKGGAALQAAEPKTKDIC